MRLRGGGATIRTRRALVRASSRSRAASGAIDGPAELVAPARRRPGDTVVTLRPMRQPTRFGSARPACKQARGSRVVRERLGCYSPAPAARLSPPPLSLPLPLARRCGVISLNEIVRAPTSAARQSRISGRPIGTLESTVFGRRLVRILCFSAVAPNAYVHDANKVPLTTLSLSLRRLMGAMRHSRRRCTPAGGEPPVGCCATLRAAAENSLRA